MRVGRLLIILDLYWYLVLVWSELFMSSSIVWNFHYVGDHRIWNLRKMQIYRCYFNRRVRFNIFPHLLSDHRSLLKGNWVRNQGHFVDGSTFEIWDNVAFPELACIQVRERRCILMIVNIVQWLEEFTVVIMDWAYGWRFNGECWNTVAI